ncbi:MAG TPA: M56 family metallopeptidase [Gemmatimonadales bacterium]|nr:M56 family metallopeptidase [Gemmatimonadales bacterium]
MSFVPAPALAKIALLVLAGLVAAGALRGTPARARHDLWLLVIAGTVVLLLAGLLLPAVFFTVPPSWLPFAAPPTASGVALLVLVWAAGALVSALRLVPGLRTLRRIRLHATGLDRPDAPDALAAASRLAGLTRPVTLLVSADVRVPATWGVRRPVVALPAAAAQWPPERLRLVLLHELLHVRRRDVLVELVLEAVTLALWFHPAVWLAARQLRLERERTCDEAVIGTGARASEYCAHLVDIMRAAARGSGVVVAAGMAAPSTLEYRVRALLDEAQPGGKPPRLRLRALVFVAGALAIYCLGTLTPCLHVG